MEIKGRNKLIVRETNKIFESELDLDLVCEIRAINKEGFYTREVVKGVVGCKGIVVGKGIELTHEESIANVNRVFAETLEQAFRGLAESFNSQITYSFSVIKGPAPLSVTIEMNLVTENKIKFEVVTSAGTYEDCYLNAKKLMKEFIEELQKQMGESK